MSIESAAAAPASASATPQAAQPPAATVTKVDVAQFTPGGASSATQSDYRELGDVLLGEDMSMMGSEVENWPANAASAKPPTLLRATTSFLPPPHPESSHAQRPSLQQTQAPTSQPQAQSPAAAFFASPPVQLTRHASLPVAMMRHPVPMHGHHVQHMPYGMPAMHHGHPHHPQMVAMAPGPPLSRQRSHGFIVHQAPMPHPHYGMPRLVFHHPITGQPMAPVHHHMQVHHQMAVPSGINLSVNQQQPTNATASSSSSSTATEEKREPKSENVEPIAFTGMNDIRMSLGEIDSLALAALSEPSSKKDKDSDDQDDDEAVYGKPSTASSIGCGQDLARALDSLDKFLPEADSDQFRLSDFRPSDLAAMVAPQPPSTSSLTSHLVTPRQMSVPTSGRSALPLIMSPHLKTVTSPMTMMMGVPHSHLHTPRASPKPMATCKVGGCDRRVRSKGFCKTHGGGRKCSIEGCKKSSQNGEFCIGHGGGKKCKQEGCAKAAQSHGLCKAHGGGARCKYPNCNKSSQGGGLCRAHGGGKRCQAQGCPKGAQRGNFCATHGGFRNCKVDGCVRTDRGGGFCEVHRRGRLCKIDGCKKLSRNQGMCTMHIREDKQESGAGSDGYAHSDDGDCHSASESPLMA